MALGRQAIITVPAFAACARRAHAAHRIPYPYRIGYAVKTELFLYVTRASEKGLAMAITSVCVSEQQSNQTQQI